MERCQVIEHTQISSQQVAGHSYRKYVCLCVSVCPHLSPAAGAARAEQLNSNSRRKSESVWCCSSMRRRRGRSPSLLNNKTCRHGPERKCVAHKSKCCIFDIINTGLDRITVFSVVICEFMDHDFLSSELLLVITNSRYRDRWVAAQLMRVNNVGSMRGQVAKIKIHCSYALVIFCNYLYWHTNLLTY